jgi:hypothetical protein
MAVKTYLHVVGDSTLDNLWWRLDDTDSNLKQAEFTSIEGKLKFRGKVDNFEVVSHAYDGFTTTSVLDGDKIGRVLTSNFDSPKFKAYASVKNPKDLNTVQPLKQLSDFVHANPSAKHFVVISVGGNDFRECLDNPIKLLSIFSDVQKRYLEIVKEVDKLGLNVHPILMFQYRTSISNRPYQIYTKLGLLGSVATAVNLVSIGAVFIMGCMLKQNKISNLFAASMCTLAAAIFAGSIYAIPSKATIGILKGQHAGVTVIGALMELLYQPIVDYARKHKLCILDLSNSFNPFTHEFYESEIEPSQYGGESIAQGIAYAVQYHKENTFQVVRADMTPAHVLNLHFREWAVPGYWSVDYPSKKS